jgi:hypothetical protein
MEDASAKLLLLSAVKGKVSKHAQNLLEEVNFFFNQKLKI